MDIMQSTMVNAVNGYFRTGHMIADIAIGAIMASVVMAVWARFQDINTAISRHVNQYLNRKMRKYRYRRVIRYDDLQVPGKLSNSPVHLNMYYENYIVIDGIIQHLANHAVIEDQEIVTMRD